MKVTLAIALALSVGLTAAAQAEDLKLQFHTDKTEGTALAELLGDDEGVIGQHAVSGALPSAWGQGDAAYVPTRVLGELRDDAISSVHADAGISLEWMRDLMGQYAYTATALIPLQAQTVIVSTTTTNWCGGNTTTDDKCPSGCTASDNPKTCSGCGCAGSRVINEVS